MSLSLEINNGVLDLSPSTSITINLRSPLFDQERIERVFSYPFKLPPTPNNLHLLQHANRLDSKSRTKKYPATIKIQGVTYETGVFIISNWTDKAIEGYFNNLPMELLRTLQNLKLQDLSLPVNVVSTAYTPSIELVANLLAGGNNIAIRINDTSYIEPIVSHPLIVDQINTDHPGLATISQQGGSDFGIIIDTSVLPGIQITVEPDDVSDYVSFFPFQVDYTAEQACINDWLTHLTSIYDSIALESYRFPVIEAPQFYNDQVEEYNGLLNVHLIDQTYAYNIPGTNTHRYAIAPQINLKYIIQQVLNRVGVNTIEGDFLSDADIEKLIIFSNRALDRYISIADFFTDVTYEEIRQAGENASNPALETNIWADNFNIQDHLPEANMYDFLMSLRSTFPILYLFRNSSTVEIRRIDKLLKEAITDYTTLTEPGYQGQSAQYDGYILDYNRNTTEEVSQGGQLEKVIEGENEEDLAEFVSQWYTLYYKRIEAFSFHAPYIIPTFDGNGYSEELGLTTEVPMNLLFYHGKQNDSNANLYPYASHHNLNYAGQEVGVYSLDWSGDDGLYEKWWKEYIRLIVEGETVQRVMRLSVHQLLELRNNPFKRILINDPMGQTVGWLKEIRFKASASSLFFAEVTLVKL